MGVGYLLHEDVGDDVHSEEQPEEADEVENGEKGAAESGDTRQKDPADKKRALSVSGAK